MVRFLHPSLLKIMGKVKLRAYFSNGRDDVVPSIFLDFLLEEDCRKKTLHPSLAGLTTDTWIANWIDNWIDDWIDLHRCRWIV